MTVLDRATSKSRGLPLTRDVGLCPHRAALRRVTCPGLQAAAATRAVLRFDGRPRISHGHIGESGTSSAYPMPQGGPPSCGPKPKATDRENIRANRIDRAPQGPHVAAHHPNIGFNARSAPTASGYVPESPVRSDDLSRDTMDHRPAWRWGHARPSTPARAPTANHRGDLKPAVLWSYIVPADARGLAERLAQPGSPRGPAVGMLAQGDGAASETGLMEKGKTIVATRKGRAGGTATEAVTEHIPHKTGLCKASRRIMSTPWHATGRFASRPGGGGWWGGL